MLLAVDNFKSNRIVPACIMPAIKLSHVVAFSSEDAPAFRADNLVGGDAGGGGKWRTGVPGADRATVDLQLDRPSAIASVHLGNYGSAFVEVQVGAI